MKLLLDTHLLLWAASESPLLPDAARLLIAEPDNLPLFSAASLWEVAIKRALKRADFRVDPRMLRRGLLENGYRELPVLSEHAVAIDALAPIHKDPFDRLLLAQATVEGVPLLTSDEIVARYGAPARRVQ